MIGFYNYTVILTYMALGFGGAGIYFSFSNNEHGTFIAVLCLLTAGLCDLFDGKVARTKKDRTQDEKNFGIQIDSLSDVVCFGVLPACIGYSVCRPIIFEHSWTLAFIIPLLTLYILAGLIRLAYFNVRELNIFYGTTEDNEKVYYGLPITMSSLIVPAFYFFDKLLKDKFYILYLCLIAVIGVCFILKIKLPKPKKIAVISMALIGLALCILMIVFHFAL